MKSLRQRDSFRRPGDIHRCVTHSFENCGERKGNVAVVVDYEYPPETLLGFSPENGDCSFHLAPLYDEPAVLLAAFRDEQVRAMRENTVSKLVGGHLHWNSRLIHRVDARKRRERLRDVLQRLAHLQRS